MKFGTSFVILLLSLNLCAKVSLKQIESTGLINYQKVLLLDDPYSLLVYVDKSDQVIKLFNDKKRIYTKNTNLITDSFISLRFKVFDNGDAPYAIMKLQKGIHGEQVFVINLQSGKEVFRKTSAWPLEINVTKKRIDVKIFDEQGKKHLKHWTP